MEQPGEFYIRTPLIRSEQLSKKLGVTVWLKLENIQNSYSFKIRGISNLCKKVQYINSVVTQILYTQK